MPSSASHSKKQLQYIQNFLIKIAGGDYDSKLPIVDDSDEHLVAIQVGINMLVEELKVTTISRVFLNSIYNGINDVLIVLNETGEIQTANDIVKKLLLYADSDLIHQPIEKLVQLSDIDSVRSCISKVCEQNEPQEIGINLIAKDKTVLPVACSFSPLFDSQNNLSGILFVAKNLSSLNSAKDQLQDKNDELKLFVYKASHDLKSPVSSMLSVMNLLRKTKDIGEMQLYIKMVDDCIHKLDTIISDLLVLGQITHGEIEYQQISINEIIDSTLKSIEHVDGFDTIVFDTHIESNAQSIVTELGLLKTILLNLIDNAIKYRKQREEPSFVRIHVSEEKKGILIKIEDNGIGIAAHQQEHVFKMFHRATSISKGSGLGLYIVKTSVLKLGGTISIESTIDEGTTFTVYLPNRTTQQLN
jgi:PAS domain S-box-containing protein